MLRTTAALAAIACLFAGSAALGRPKIGQPVQPFTITSFDKTRTTSDQLRGQVVIINYWATWCGPCRKELPALDAYNRLHAKDGLRIFAVTVEDSIPDYQLKPIAAMLSFPLAHRIRGSSLGELEGVPTNYVIDRNGVLRWAEAGAFDTKTLEKVIGPLLAEPAPSTATP